MKNQEIYEAVKERVESLSVTEDLIEDIAKTIAEVVLSVEEIRESIGGYLLLGVFSQG